MHEYFQLPEFILVNTGQSVRRVQFEILDGRGRPLMRSVDMPLGLSALLGPGFRAFNVTVEDDHGRRILRVERPLVLLRSRMAVYDDIGAPVGVVVEKVLALIKGQSNLEDAKGRRLGQEFQNYEITWDEEDAWRTRLRMPPGLPADHPARQLVFAKVLCGGMIGSHSGPD